MKTTRGKNVLRSWSFSRLDRRPHDEHRRALSTEPEPQSQQSQQPSKDTDHE